MGPFLPDNNNKNTTSTLTLETRSDELTPSPPVAACAGQIWRTEQYAMCLVCNYFWYPFMGEFMLEPMASVWLHNQKPRDAQLKACRNHVDGV